MHLFHEGLKPKTGDWFLHCEHITPAVYEAGDFYCGVLKEVIGKLDAVTGRIYLVQFVLFCPACDDRDDYERFEKAGQFGELDPDALVCLPGDIARS